MFDAAKQDAFRTIDASGLPPAEKEALRKKAEEMFALTIGEREIRDAEVNPLAAGNAAGRLGVTGAVTTTRGGDAMSLLRKFEGFRETPYWDVNAHRVGYGSDTITTADGRKVKVEQGMKVSRADAERDLARRTKEFERGAAGQVGVQAWNNLEPNVQAALVSVAYNYGSLPSNVVDAVRSGDVTRIAASVEFRGSDNGGVNRKRRIEEANIIRGGTQITGNAPAFDPSSMDPRYANLSLSQRLSLYDQTQAAAQRGQTAIDAQTKAAYDSEKGDLQLGIQTGNVSSDQQIMQSRMTDSDKATLLSTLRSRQGDQVMTAQAMADFQNGALSIDPYSSDGKKKVDAIGGVINQAVAPENRQAALDSLVTQSGTVPQSTMNQLRAGAESQVPSEVETALQAASRFSQINSSALSRRDGGSAVQKKVDDFDYYVNTLNLSPSDAARRIAEQNDPNKIRERKALEPAVKEFRKQIENTDIGSMFDDSWLPFTDPKVGFNEQQAFGIAADYMAIAEEQFYASGGNPELAKNRANAEMKRLYGTTDITGTKTIMKYPPEKFWPAKPDDSEPYGYIKDQLINDLAQAFPNDQLLNPIRGNDGYRGLVEGREVFIQNEDGLSEYRTMIRDNVMSRIVLVSMPETGSEVKSNQLPGYTVLYKDEQGNLQTLYGKQWRPDLSVVLTAARQQQDKRLETATRNQASGFGMAEYISGGDIPMGASSAWDNPEAQQVMPQPTVSNISVPTSQTPTVKSGLDQQRSQLFQSAKDSGLLNAGGN